MSAPAARYEPSEHEETAESLLNAMLDQVETSARTLIENGAEGPLRMRLARVLGEKRSAPAEPPAPPQLPVPANDTTELALRFANALGALRRFRDKAETEGARRLTYAELRKAMAR